MPYEKLAQLDARRLHKSVATDVGIAKNGLDKL